MDGGSSEPRRHRSVGAIGALLAIALLVGAPPARAGGWWNSIAPRGLWAPGLRVQITVDNAWFPTIEKAERAVERGSFHAYLLSDFDYEIVDRALEEDFRPDWWDLGDATTTHLGPVTLSEHDVNLIRATTQFTVPDIPPGRYFLMFCDRGCERSFADVIPTPVTMIEDPVVAGLSRRIEHLRERAERIESVMHARVWRLGRRVDRLSKELKQAEPARTEQSAADASKPDGPSASTPIFVGSTGALALAAALLLWRRRATAAG